MHTDITFREINFLLDTSVTDHVWDGLPVWVFQSVTSTKATVLSDRDRPWTLCNALADSATLSLMHWRADYKHINTKIIDRGLGMIHNHCHMHADAAVMLLNLLIFCNWVILSTSLVSFSVSSVAVLYPPPPPPPIGKFVVSNRFGQKQADNKVTAVITAITATNFACMWSLLSSMSSKRFAIEVCTVWSVRILIFYKVTCWVPGLTFRPTQLLPLNRQIHHSWVILHGLSLLLVLDAAFCQQSIQPAGLRHKFILWVTIRHYNHNSHSNKLLQTT